MSGHDLPAAYQPSPREDDGGSSDIAARLPEEAHTGGSGNLQHIEEAGRLPGVELRLFAKGMVKKYREGKLAAAMAARTLDYDSPDQLGEEAIQLIADPRRLALEEVLGFLPDGSIDEHGSLRSASEVILLDVSIQEQTGSRSLVDSAFLALHELDPSTLDPTQYDDMPEGTMSEAIMPIEAQYRNAVRDITALVEDKAKNGVGYRQTPLTYKGVDRLIRAFYEA